jgi:hypothetical protein
MCNICRYPDKGNHRNWGECAEAWRGRSQQAESVIAEQKAHIAALEAELAASHNQAEIAVEALDDLHTDLVNRLYATADYDLDRARRALDGRAA